MHVCVRVHACVHTCVGVCVYGYVMKHTVLATLYI